MDIVIIIMDLLIVHDIEDLNVIIIIKNPYYRDSPNAYNEYQCEHPTSHLTSYDYVRRHLAIRPEREDTDDFEAPRHLRGISNVSNCMFYILIQVVILFSYIRIVKT